MNVTLRDKTLRNILQVPTKDDERSGLYALLEIYPLEAISDDADHGGLVDVVMVGWGDVFMSRARDYQERHAAALAEWQAWDDISEDFSEKHSKKLAELNVKYDLASELCGETRFKIVEIMKP
jgi:hypothetical protein